MDTIQFKDFTIMYQFLESFLKWSVFFITQCKICYQYWVIPIPSANNFPRTPPSPTPETFWSMHMFLQINFAIRIVSLICCWWGNLELSNKVIPLDKFGRKIYLPISLISFYGIEPYQEIDNYHVDINYRTPCRHTVININKIEVDDM